MAASSQEELLLMLYHHVVLPREVPGQEDRNLYQLESELLRRLTEAVKVLATHTPLNDLPFIDALRLGLATCSSLNVDGKIDKHMLVRELRQLEAKHILILHVTEQNAGLLIYRATSDNSPKSVVFEAFETSATCERVLAAKHSLLWDFPGQAVSIPDEVYDDDDFQEALSAFLEQASLEPIKQFAAITHKAYAPLSEIRDTPAPTLVTGPLMALLEVNGGPYTTFLLQKRVRDTVSFSEAHKPWRRSPFYLMLRVAIQRHLYNILGECVGRLYYKTVMCIFLSRLLEDGTHAIAGAASDSMRKKLARRLAKMEVECDNQGSPTIRRLHGHLAGALQSSFEKSLSTAARTLGAEWEAYKEQTRRIIYTIPQFAKPYQLKLRLLNSGPELTEAMNLRFNTALSTLGTPQELLGRYEATTSLKPFFAVVNRYIPLCDYEEYVSNDLNKKRYHGAAACIHIARQIQDYVSTIGDAYVDYPEFTGQLLLKVMELWKAMDEHAVRCYPLLGDYDPGFDPAMLDMLQLSNLDHFERLQTLQSYLAKRCLQGSRCGSKTIFDPPAKDSFAVRFYDESSEAAELQTLRKKVEKVAENRLAIKEAEWNNKTKEHESKIQQMAGLACPYVTEVDKYGNTRQVHQKGCRKHRLKWEAKQISIDIHEHPLPRQTPMLKATIFELMCPKAFAAYRDATWLILSSFAYPAAPPVNEVHLLRLYSGLRQYANNTATQITLGSLTKSHLDTHYAKSEFPTPFRDINRAFGMKLKYIDSTGQIWTKKEQPPSFAHLFKLKLPPDSSYYPFEDMHERWPTSNEILATQFACPQDLNVHEYMAWQGLLIGTFTKLPCLLRELGSTNINFSTQSAWAIVSRMCHEVGPSSADSVWRDTHSMFKDRTFCKQLLAQVKYRLEAIQRNWREPLQMDLLMTILLKVTTHSLSETNRNAAIDLLAKARNITQYWFTSLDLANLGDGSTPSSFAIWAAVLRKRSFYHLFQAADGVPPELLHAFVVASITLQDCLSGEFEVLPYSLRNAILRDLSLSHNHRQHVKIAIEKNQSLLLEAVRTVWPMPAECAELPFRLDTSPDSWWVSMTLSTRYDSQHHAHFNILNGTLLIDGQQRGTLPPAYRRWPIIEELLGPHCLQTYPSALQGMSLVISRPMNGDHWVHLGFRQGRLVIRAEHKGNILEFFHRSVFRSEQHCDFPAALTDHCYHWLNLGTATLEVRKQYPWKSKKGNWQLDLNTGEVTRGHDHRLVDPSSDLAKRIAQNFHHFEHPTNITVYKPLRGPLRIELKRLELDFEVASSGLLYCPQLGAVVAPTSAQDVGTWYGLKSKLVIHAAHDESQRSILLPMGIPTFRLDGPHVSIVIQNVGNYLKFGINSILGRVECPAEPVLLYQRALWHALTAYFLPDPLTGRTGNEEALQYLRSGAYRPWMPLAGSACDLLFMITKLSPPRNYYPPARKIMESVSWSTDLTVHIQDDRYRRAVNEILARNQDLLKFAQDASFPGAPTSVLGETHLEDRALSRDYTRRSQIGFNDDNYASRDRRIDGLERRNVVEMASLLNECPSQVVSTTQLPTLLEKLPVIGGYVRTFDKVQITDILETDVGIDWGALVMTAQQSSPKPRFRLIFLFSLLAFASEADMELLRTIACFSFIPDLKTIPLPKVTAYSNFLMNETLKATDLVSVEAAKLPYVPTRSTTAKQAAKRRLAHESEGTRACELYVKSVLAQWPSELLDLSQVATTDNNAFDRDEALSLVLPLWRRFFDHAIFSKHVTRVQRILLAHNVEGSSTVSQLSIFDIEPLPIFPVVQRSISIPSLQQILEKGSNALNARGFGRIGQSMAELALASRPTQSPQNVGHSSPIVDEIKELNRLIAPMVMSQSEIHKRYGRELESSIDALSDHLSKPERQPTPFNPTELSNDMFNAKQHLQKTLKEFQNALGTTDVRAKWLGLADLWPRMTIVTLLAALRSTSGVDFGAGVKEVLIDLGITVTNYQRLLRIQNAARKGQKQQLADEIANIGHEGWSPLKHTDWLLLEIESNFLIRVEQVEVALATINPASGQNSVVQLLMGKGKTSCILPMVALELAAINLFRIVVPRPLLLQSAQIMQSKLGGLLDREVLHLPFSRRTPTDTALIQTYRQMHLHVQKQCGIVLALPEHLLSFKLSGLQRLCDKKFDQAALMVETQNYFDGNARDVLDECDVTLGIRTQLIYPSGSQQTVDGHPLRWQTVQALLDLFFSHLDDLINKFPQSIEIARRDGLPLVYFLRKDVEEYLVGQLVQKICTGQTTILATRDFSKLAQQDICKFISDPCVDKKSTARVFALFPGKHHVVDVILHLRGLFVHGILLSTLKKRWNVQYGLHPTRAPIAVPYQAKGVPSSTAEWGHPDVAIILTCLSFYYEGLSMSQFKQALNQVAKSDEPSIEYTLWVAEGVPDAFKNYSSINVEDSQQLRELHQYIRCNVCLLDFFLNHYVFPRHAKQFSMKLSASGSDLIIFDPLCPDKASTTGFSGTNDTRHQLPMSIKQNDLPQLAHTNAEVLAYLLQPRNRQYERMVDKNNKRLSEVGMIEKLAQGCIRVFVDAGAQILEHDNRGVAKAWLKEDEEAVAALFFDHNHRAMIVYRKGTAETPLVASPFAEDLSKCVVYIDESHCRGIDLKLPPTARAAVTLGPHLTKDTLVQAAMRLRLLGTTQSITFFSPPEVHQAIEDLRPATVGWLSHRPSSVDVIRWLLQQTCNAIDQLEPLYFNQSLDYLQRTQAKIDNPDFIRNPKSRRAYLGFVRSREMQSLEQLYAPKYQNTSSLYENFTFAGSLEAFYREVLQRKKCLQDRGAALDSTTLEEVEQEREIEFELESVREIQAPVYFEALDVGTLHKDIRQFAMTGVMSELSDAFEPMILTLRDTDLGRTHDTISLPGITARLYVSTQFNSNVNVTEPNDSFLRPCHWLLWHCKHQLGLLVSPEEANILIPILRSASADDLTCHLITYAAPTTRRMLQFNALNYYAIPRLPKDFVAPAWLKVEFGIFAGRLYFEWDEYEEICSYLGLQSLERQCGEQTQSMRKQAFSTKPLTFLHDWLALRRKGHDFEHTPMGFITTGKPLSANHTFFSDAGKEKDRTNGQQLSLRLLPSLDKDSNNSDDDAEYDKEHLFQRDSENVGYYLEAREM